MPKVLVAVVTYAGERYALVPLLQGLQKQLYQDFDILFVDNSDSLEYVTILKDALKVAFPTRKADVEHVFTTEERFDRIVQSRNTAREYFLKGSYTHLFFVDSDVLLPRSALLQLLAAKQSLVTGVYLNGSVINGKNEIRPSLFIDTDGASARQATIAEVLSHQRLAIGAAGLGCSLIAREILEKISFRLNAHGQGEDVCFYRDAIELDVQPVAICSVKCLHLQFPLGDARNKLLDLTQYKLETNKKDGQVLTQ